MIDNKSSVLFKLVIEIVCIMLNLDFEIKENIINFSKYLGMAF